MIERDSRNFIEWREPDDTTLDIVPKADSIDEEEVEAIFDVQFTTDLVEDDEVLSRNS